MGETDYRGALAIPVKSFLNFGSLLPILGMSCREERTGTTASMAALAWTSSVALQVMICFFGDSSADKLYGGDGNDALRGGDGNEVIFGGSGITGGNWVWVKIICTEARRTTRFLSEACLNYFCTARLIPALPRPTSSMETKGSAVWVAMSLICRVSTWTPRL